MITSRILDLGLAAAHPTLLSTNFANYDQGRDTQSFGGPNGSGGYLTGGTYAPYTGATEKKTLEKDAGLSSQRPWRRRLGVLSVVHVQRCLQHSGAQLPGPI